MRIIKDFVFIKIDKEFEDTIKHKSLQLILNPTYNTFQHVRIFGEVTAIPEKLNPDWKIEPEVKVRDRIYFHFHCICKENRIYLNGGHIYKIPYKQIYCSIRKDIIAPYNKEIIMIGAHVFVKPEMQTEKEIVTGSGVITQTHTKPKTLTGYIKHIGTPLIGERVIANQGDRIYYLPESDIKINIENEEYYRMKQKDIIAKLL